MTQPHSSRNNQDTSQYLELIKKIAGDAGDILVYSERGAEPDSVRQELISAWVNLLEETDRSTCCLIPSSPENISLVLPLLNRGGSKLKVRVLERQPCQPFSELFIFGGTAAVIQITDEEITIIEHTDGATYSMYRNLFKATWDQARNIHEELDSTWSELTSVERSVYMSDGTLIDLTDLAPSGLNPQWIQDIYLNRSGEDYTDAAPHQLLSNIGRYFQQEFGVSNSLVAPTATISFITVCSALLSNRGGEFIVLDPGFDVYPKIVRTHGGRVIYTPRKSDLQIDLAAIRDSFSERTRALVVVTPDNPSGRIVTKEQLVDLAETCRERNVTLVLDYCLYKISAYGSEVPLLSRYHNTQDMSVVMITDTGKWLGLGGTKLGISLFSQNMQEALTKFSNNYYFRINQHDLFVLNKILNDPRLDGYTAELLTTVRRNYEHIVANIDPAIVPVPTQATSLCLLDISRLGVSDLSAAVELREKYELAVIPVSYFHTTTLSQKHRYIRLALARPQEIIMEVISRINEYAESKLDRDAGLDRREQA